ncbi:MAG: pre-peptidase C-terminal domain-containing protein [Planctomycetaceae bacterium]|nr:pre-peptidase C-terminal domain-containing protein [Planctomycetaceae bacterium]
MRIAWTAVACALLSTSLFAAAPRLSNVLPHGVQRGTEAEISLSGTNLEDAEELLLYDNGMEVVEFSHPEDEKQKGRILKVKLRIAADCPLGSQRMRIRTRTGLSDMQNLHVGALPVVEEKEPNTEFDTPQVIENNVTIHGRIDREDVDYFVIEAKQGERITAEVFGMRLGFSSGGNYFDPYVAILNEDRFELATADDTPLVWNDGVASIIAPKDGKYTVQIRDAAYNGDGRAYYLLHIGNFPRPHAVVPAGGKPGETLNLTFLGDVAGPITREITLPTEVPERFAVDVQDDHGIAPSGHVFRLVDLPNSIEQEPNNDRTQATAGTAPGAFNGVIQEPDDFDFFKFTATKDQEFEVEVYAKRIRSALDSVVYVYQMEKGNQVAANDDSRGQDSYLRFKAPADGEYCVAVRDHLRGGSDRHVYRIEITPVTPSVKGEPTEFARYVQPDIVIPQGSGSGVVVNVQRQNFGGPVNFRSDDLPAGVRIECPEGWRTQGSIPVVFYADEAAPVAGKFSKIVTYLADPEKPDSKVEGPLLQKMLMTRGQNNNRVWEEEQIRLPIIVGEKAPFRVWMETPKVPLVRGGSMNLIVKCEKQEGWDEDIQVLLLQNPSGVNSSRSVKIAKGQTEAQIPINAAGNAAIQESLIALRCIAKVGNGNIETCTEHVPLRVEEQYVTFEFAQAAVEQGKEIPVVIKVAKRKDFEGEAEVQLVGLPANTTAEPLKMTKEMEELVFTVKTTAETPPGDNKNVLCQVYIPENGDKIHHSLGTGRLRVDRPLPPKNNAPKPEPKPEPVVKTEAPPKPLSRLEMLRLEQKEKEEAENK